MKLSMTSREIAELTGKRHDAVLRDARNMLDAIGAAHSSVAGNYIDGNGQSRPMFELDRDLTMTLVTGYDVAMRMAIIDRWQPCTPFDSEASNNSHR